jgi:hypothetical protein
MQYNRWRLGRSERILEVGDVDVVVYKCGREIDRVRRPLCKSADGPAVTYQRQLWPFRDGAVNLDRPPVANGTSSEVSPPENSGGPDATQLAVINRPSEDRLRVEAGPGTGKTYVACARVAALIAQGVPPSRIWLISFTRTAVVEIRTRIAVALDSPADAASVCVATLDSQSWALQSGFSSGARLTGSFDQSIETTLTLIEDDEDLRDYLGSKIRHLVVDEGQDIVGSRAKLTLAIIRALGEDCGVTVFADEAQAIHGFGEEGGRQRPVGPPLLKQLEGERFGHAALTTVHRTSRINLRTLLVDVRRKVLSHQESPGARRKVIEADIRRCADEDAGSVHDLQLEDVPDNALILARRRVDILLLSSMQAAVPHRLRMSGLPVCLQPWPAVLFWDYTGTRLTRTHFEQLWVERSVSQQPGSPDCESAWRLLVELAGETSATVGMDRLREALARANPPMLFCTPEFGHHGPILGTIHASKGREADDVTLYLPRPDERPKGPDAKNDPEEEIRVLFVGATRARQYLRVGSASAVRATSTGHRVWRWIQPTGSGPDRRRRIQVEIGSSGDVMAEGLVGQRAFAAQDDALAAQALWLNSPIQKELHARSEARLDWDWVLESAAGTRLGVLAPKFASDVQQIASEMGYWPPPRWFPYLRSIGARSVVIRPDDPQLETLHEPWRISGFLSAPLLTGFSTGSFPKS